MSDKSSSDSPKVKPVNIPNFDISDMEAGNISDRSATDPTSLTAADLDSFLAWKKKRTGEYLNAQPKVPLFIPFREGEDRNNKAFQYEFFGINGYYILVRKGIMVEVPKPVAEMWSESQQQGSTTNEYLLGNISMKIDPVTGGRKSISKLVG